MVSDHGDDQRRHVEAEHRAEHEIQIDNASVRRVCDANSSRDAYRMNDQGELTDGLIVAYSVPAPVPGALRSGLAGVSTDRVRH